MCNCKPRSAVVDWSTVLQGRMSLHEYAFYCKRSKPRRRRSLKSTYGRLSAHYSNLTNRKLSAALGTSLQPTRRMKCNTKSINARINAYTTTSALWPLMAKHSFNLKLNLTDALSRLILLIQSVSRSSERKQKVRMKLYSRWLPPWFSLYKQFPFLFSFLFTKISLLSSSSSSSSSSPSVQIELNKQ